MVDKSSFHANDDVPTISHHQICVGQVEASLRMVGRQAADQARRSVGIPWAAARRRTSYFASRRSSACTFGAALDLSTELDNHVGDVDGDYEGDYDGDANEGDDVGDDDRDLGVLIATMM